MSPYIRDDSKNERRVALKTLLYVLIAAELIFVLIYAMPNVRKSKSKLPVKTVCAVTYVLIGIAAALASGGYFTSYAILLTIGAVFGAIGDYSLNMDPKSKKFIIGVGSFLIGHVFYTAAFATALVKNSALQKKQIIMLTISAAAVSLLVVAAGVLLKVSPGVGLPPVILYNLAISTMLVFAVSTAVNLIKNQGSGAYPAALMVSLGAVLFVVSDAVLAIIHFSKRKIKIPHAVNSWTYFPAQVMLALSIYFIQSLMV